MTTPRFSIVIPTYERAHALGPTLQAVADQEHPSFEVLVVDDGGSDDTRRVVEGLGDPRFRYFWKENGERGAARNFGAQRASGEYVIFLDSDDLLHPHHLGVVDRALAERTDPEAVITRSEVRTPEGHVLARPGPEGDRVVRDEFLNGNLGGGMSGLVLRRDVALANPFEEDRRLATAEDWQLLLRLAARHPVHLLGAVTWSLVEHGGRSVLGRSEARLEETRGVLLETLARDPAFMERWGPKGLVRVEAHMESYAGLHLVLSGEVGAGWRHWARAGRLRPREVFTWRFLATIKHTLLPGSGEARP